MSRSLPARQAECRASADRLEQELQNLYVSLGVCQCVAPGVEPVSTQEKGVGLWVSIQHLADRPCKTIHVLIVVDNRNMLGMLVGADAGQPFEHLEAIDRYAVSVRRRRR